MAFLYPGASQATVERFLALQRQAATLAADYTKTRDYRAYYAGDHPVMLSTRQQEYLGDILTESPHTVAFNLCKVVVDVLRERLSISGFTGADAAGQALATQVWQWWEAANMGLESITATRRALRDGAGYLIVDWNAEAGAPRWKANSKYDGDTGVTMHKDANDVPFMAVKYWRRDDILTADYGALRRTIYLPDRIMRYREDVAGTYGWTPIDPTEGAPVQFWTDTLREGGKPLGLACVEFLNPGGVSEIEAIIGLQNALNKLLLDLLAAGDATGFQMLVASYPGPLSGGATDDDDETTDDIRIAPGRLLEIGDGATITNIPPGDLSQLLKALDAVIGFIGASTRTPQYYLRPFGGADVPSGEALKQLESALVSRAKERQTQFAGAWVDAMRVAARLWLAMGGRGLDAEAPLTAAWASAEVRNELYDTQVATAEDALGIPREHLWQHRLGYSPEEVAEFKQMTATADAAKLASVLSSLNLGAGNGNGNGGAFGAGGNVPDRQANGEPLGAGNADAE
jgi:hypothetical protein